MSLIALTSAGAIESSERSKSLLHLLWDGGSNRLTAYARWDECPPLSLHQLKGGSACHSADTRCRRMFSPSVSVTAYIMATDSLQ